MSLASGVRLGPYEVVSRLGAGGMGEVYRAIDTRLDRIVALKVLPPDRVGDSDARARFAREAKAIAALSHPNICAIHDVGLADPTAPPYLVMELLEGETLQARLARGPLEIDAVVEYGLALADALETAHARGLIHRDLKPANIFITSRGIPKILDFGLAKMLDQGSQDRGLHAGDVDMTRRPEDVLTELGTTVGTVAYMSPEQLRGEMLDVRSDLFAFGLVLYEMATGQRAFAGATSAVVSAAILVQDPVLPTAMRPDLPPRLEETILKALEKDRNVRSQTAAELRADLMRLKRQSGPQTTRLTMPAATIPARGPIATMSGAGSARDLPTRLGTANAEVSGIATAPATSTGNRGLWVGLAVLASFVILGGSYWLGAGRNSTSSGAPPLAAAPAPAPASAPAAVPATPTPSPIPVAPASTVVSAPARTPVQTASPSPAAAAAATDRSTPASPEPAPAARGGRNTGPGRRGAPGTGLPTLVSTLKGLPPLSFDLAYATGDDRPRELAMGLRSALTAAGWTCATMTEVPGQHSPLAVFLPQPSTSASALLTWARRNGFDPEVRPAPRLPRMRIIIGR